MHEDKEQSGLEPCTPQVSPTQETTGLNGWRGAEEPQVPCCCSLLGFGATLMEQQELLDMEAGAFWAVTQWSLLFFPEVNGISLALSGDLIYSRCKQS